MAWDNDWDVPFCPHRCATHIVHDKGDLEIVPLFDSLGEIDIFARGVLNPGPDVPGAQFLELIYDLAQFLRVAAVQDDIEAASVQLLGGLLPDTVRGPGDECIGCGAVYELIHSRRTEVEN